MKVLRKSKILYNYQNTIAQLAYKGCESIVLKGGTLVVQYERAGEKTDIFRGIAVSERKKIRALLNKKISLSGTRGYLSARIHLCPRCTRKLMLAKNKCLKCRLSFKSKLVAAFSAILIPGGGYFYIRQNLLGCLDALLEIVSLGLIVYLLNELRNQMPVEPLHLALIPVFLYLKIGAVVHSTHFVKEFIPKDFTDHKRGIVG